MNRILPKGELLPVPLLGGLSFGAPLRVEDGEGKAAFLEPRPPRRRTACGNSETLPPPS